LRLQWAWLKWKAPDKPFAGLPISLNNTEKELLKCCAEIHVGNGSKTKFWTDNCLKGTEPKDIAPSCFKLAFRKNQSVAKALTNRTWMHGPRQMTTDTELRQFVQLWAQLQDVNLTTEEDIAWRFTTSISYTAKSAYEVQEIGKHPIRKGSIGIICIRKGSIRIICILG
jgi:hypothetical protein